MLTVNDVVKRFGGIVALDGASMTAVAGAVTGLIGPNGSGKSTLFDVITGFVERDSGEVTLDGVPLNATTPEIIVSQGIGRTFQVPRVARRMTVLENLMVVPAEGQGESVLRLFSPWHARRVRDDEAGRLRAAQSMAERLGLGAMLNEYAGTLSGGQLKLLSTAKVLMMDPPVLLLDEPCAGVNPALIGHLLDFLSARRDEGLTTVVIEHDMDVIAMACDTVHVMHSGKIIVSGTPDAVREHETVVDIYLGRRCRKEE